METRLRINVLVFRPICKNKYYWKSSTHIIELIKKTSTLNSSPKYSEIFAKIHILKKSKMAAKMANVAGNHGLIGLWKWLCRSRFNLCHLQQVLLVHILPTFHNKEVIIVMIFTVRCPLNWFERNRTTLWWLLYFSKCQNQNTLTLIFAHRWLLVMSYNAGKYCSCRESHIYPVNLVDLLTPIY